jgi:nucleoid-associated protein YgaU
VKSGDNHLLKTVTTYNAENRATRSDSTDKDGKHTISKNTYDAVGNVVDTRIDGDGYGFNEVTKRDVRYLEQRKDVRNSFAKGAKGLSGATAFTYDANGNLSFLDRGKKQGSSQKSVAYFEYDLEGRIIGRADKATAATGGGYFEGFFSDPAAAYSSGEYDFSRRTLLDDIRAQVIGNGSGATLQSYLYANNRQLAQAQGKQSVALRSLSLTGATPITETVTSGIGESVSESSTLLGWQLTLTADDIVAPNGQLDRAATARRIAELHYAGWHDLSAGARDKLAAYVESQLPATITAGTQLKLHGYIVMADAGMGDITQITDYSVKRIGLDGMPAGSVQSHVVRAGDTLQSIAQIYFGSPSYWYLIADANGLQGHEALQEGTTITIPNKVVNAANTSDTFKVYNESEIIGSTSPEIRTIKKKKKWYQKLVMVLIVVIMIVAAVITAGAALAIAGAATPGLLAVGAGLATSLGATALTGVAAFAAAAAIGATVYAAASILTQGLAVASGLQESFSWKAVGKAAVSGAISGGAGFLGASAAVTQFFGNSQLATRVAVEVGKQLVTDGKINNVAGIVGAAVGAGALGGQAARYAGTISAGLNILENKVRGRGDNAMQWVAWPRRRCSTAVRSMQIARQQRALMLLTDRPRRSTLTRPAI